MAGLATATVSRLGAADSAVLNRSASNADRLAGEYSARALALTELHDVLAKADVVISCTGASGVVITTDQVAAARAGNSEPIVFLDLALPRDIEEGVAALPGVTVIDLRRLADALSHRPEERRDGNEGDRTCRFRWSADHQK